LIQSQAFINIYSKVNYAQGFLKRIRRRVVFENKNVLKRIKTGINRENFGISKLSKLFFKFFYYIQESMIICFKAAEISKIAGRI